MENGAAKKASVADTILARFQEISKEKEEAAKPKEEVKITSQIQETVKRKLDNADLHEGIIENDVGISQFLSDHPGFSGIIKHRFSDFQVHEIDTEGNVVELTSVEPVPIIEEDLSNVSKDVISEEHWSQIEEALTDPNKVVMIDVTDKDKSERALIHHAVKKVHGSNVYSQTSVVEDKTVIKIGKRKSPGAERWPKNAPEYLHFTVTKRNMDTTSLVYLISKRLRMKPNNFTYAGTKDRRGVTSQRMCVRRRRAEELAKEKLWGVMIGDYCYKSKPLRLGDLTGNKFTLTIRNVKEEDEVINSALESLKRTGFINYFGLQRFGSSLVSPTYVIGKALMKKDWKLAVEMILKPRPEEKGPHSVRLARETWWSGRDAAAALKHLSKNQDLIEHKVLKALRSAPNNYHDALLEIPRNTLLLYFHSYQSYIWNKVVSRRIERYGQRPIAGDLVLTPGAELDPVEGELEPADEGETTPDNTEVKEDEVRGKVAVQALSEEEAKTTAIHDVVYPLPGFDIEYPKNEIADWYRELLVADGLSLDNLKNNCKLFSLTGAYRKAIHGAEDLSWRIVSHENLDDDLVLSDLDKFEGKTLPQQSQDGKYKSVIVDITLNKSAYATMALREGMKSNTSVFYHASLTKSENSRKKVRSSTAAGQSTQ